MENIMYQVIKVRPWQGREWAINRFTSMAVHSLEYVDTYLWDEGEVCCELWKITERKPDKVLERTFELIKRNVNTEKLNKPFYLDEFRESLMDYIAKNPVGKKTR